MGKVQTSSPQTEDQAAIMVDWMGKVLLELLDSWSLRKKDTPYTDGLDRPKLDLSLQEIAQLPFDDIGYLYTEAASLLTTTNPKAQITPAAVEAGLNHDNFRPFDPDSVHLPGGYDPAAGEP